ncbi:MAG: alkaline phosphatase family protein [Xanthomonadales bacterium]|nr:alkaline phosphatase family protein [Gammaproteobacteria bacterium]NNJ79391.1 alkaline phosphatase family protein [Xanthomonadales bacterium]NNL04986.1 alkaline phosphatase family protein [Xanthomonadales bacterium]
MQADKPDLVLQITVDQLRADVIRRHFDRFGEGGFQYLVEHGTVYANARYRHANTMTAVGHATLATGGNSTQHGMVSNSWWDRERSEHVNCLQDEQSPFVDETTRTGRSPLRLTSSTFSDELILATGGASRSFGVSTKDRGAIILAGRGGKAYWYSTQTGRYTTTTWYHREHPEWVEAWNERDLAAAYAGQTWSLLADHESYAAVDRDDRPFEVPRGELGITFPHVMSDSTSGRYFSDLRYSPWADELTLSFTQALIEAEKPGQRGATDYLSVSFSATDYVGHAYGPYSLEAEDNLLRLDRVIAALLASVDQAVGLQNTLVVLSSDHGVQATPEYSGTHGFVGGRIGTAEMLGPINDLLSTYFETDERLIAAFSRPSLFLDLEALRRAGISRTHAEVALAREVVKLDGVRAAFTRTDLLEGNLPATALARSVAHAFHPQRSGDVYVVAEPFWFFGYDTQGDAATHGSHYPADAHVPLIFSGPGVPRTSVYRPVAPRDVAPTLSAYLGVLPPSGSVGEVLGEVVGEAKP